ncbi:MAG TPA: sigma-70 family RNA polymerase sigma factor [Phycisphaerales bacterium]|nr:sigma-70 family RNA polymerase sigma factor [Phycisphaerales bacterium]
MIEDKLFIWRFKHGSSVALGRIYKKYKDDLLRLAVALLNETSVAEDVVQDCFVSFAQSAEKIKLAGNLKSYLATCVANRARNWNRAMQRQSAWGRLPAETANPNGTESAVSSSKRPEQWIIYSEQLRRLNNAMAQLPYEQREAVSLHIQGGMKFKAIAELQGVSINTIQSRYRYGLDKLRSILDSEVTK